MLDLNQNATESIADQKAAARLASRRRRLLIVAFALIVFGGTAPLIVPFYVNPIVQEFRDEDKAIVAWVGQWQREQDALYKKRFHAAWSLVTKPESREEWLRQEEQQELKNNLDKKIDERQKQWEPTYDGKIKAMCEGSLARLNRAEFIGTIIYIAGGFLLLIGVTSSAILRFPRLKVRPAVWGLIAGVIAGMVIVLSRLIWYGVENNLSWQFLVCVSALVLGPLVGWIQGFLMRALGFLGRTRADDPPPFPSNPHGEPAELKSKRSDGANTLWR